MPYKKYFRKRYVHYRIRSPKQFKPSSIRTHDIGRKGHSLRKAGRLKSTGKWATKSILVTRSDYKKGLRVRKKYGRPTVMK